ncbi:Glyoxalase [Tenacibaculum sp. 190524A02b]|uniref:Glyoxalase n=1 Tax=Tenacibaculum vairaonense TaxID=3137860 RepID=A0ABP1F5Y9_9FLAO
MKIKKLKIHTQNFTAQIDFYTNVLNIPIAYKTETEVCFKIGNTDFILEKHYQSYPYHFAITIPANKEKEALTWLKERVSILTFEQQEIQDFKNWKAKAMYFYDKDKNIVEFIARKNLNNDSDQPFQSDSLVEISEIGLPVTTIQETYQTLSETVPLAIYDGNFERFCAIGDENGLFICIDKNAKDWFPTNDKAYSAPFEIDFTESNNQYHLSFTNGQVHISELKL